MVMGIEMPTAVAAGGLLQRAGWVPPSASAIALLPLHERLPAATAQVAGIGALYQHSLALDKGDVVCQKLPECFRENTVMTLDELAAGICNDDRTIGLIAPRQWLQFGAAQYDPIREVGAQYLCRSDVVFGLQACDGQAIQSSGDDGRFDVTIAVVRKIGQHLRQGAQGFLMIHKMRGVYMPFRDNIE